MTAATTLIEALDTLDPEVSLRTSEQLDAFFVERPETPADDLAIVLQSKKPQKILFTGHRGSGKSTELANLARNLKRNGFFVVDFSIKDTLDLFDLTYVDVLLSIGMELFKNAIAAKIEISPGVLDHFRQFAEEITREDEHSKKRETEGGLEFAAFLSKLTGRYKQESATRQIIRRKVSHRLSELFFNIQILASFIGERRLVIIVDGLDKPDLAKAKEIFYDNATSLCEPPVSIIYTFPSALRHDPNFLQVRSSFGSLYVLPNIKVQHKEGKPADGCTVLRDMLLKRAVPKLMPEDTLQRLVSCSSGIPREMIALSRIACIEAIKNKRKEIQVPDVERAMKNRRVDYDVLLDTRQRALLREVEKTKRIENDEEHRILLHSLAVIEYRNGDVWYDVNPLVKPLLPTQESDVPRDDTA